MKKKLISVLLTLAVVIGCASPGFAASESGEYSRGIFGSLYGYIIEILGGGSNGVQKPPASISGTQKPPAGISGAAGAGSGGSETGDSSVNVQQSASSEVRQILNLVNKERTKAGAADLSLDGQLNKLAQLKAEDMAKNKYFSHNSPTYGSAFDMMKAYGVAYRTAGENIAMGQKTPESVMKGWMNSSGHRANILSTAYTAMGVGVARDASGKIYWVQMFKG